MLPEIMIRNIQKQSEKTNKKINISVFIAIFIIFAIFTKLIFVQIINSSNLKQVCEKKHKIVLKDKAERGYIYDRNNNIIVLNLESYNLYVYTKAIKNKNELIKKLSNTNILNSEEIKKKLNNSLLHIPIKYNLTKKEIEKIKQLNEHALLIKKEKIRYYPYSKIYSGIIGFVGLDNEGLEGIEYEFKNILSGKDGFLTYQKKPTGRIFKHPSYRDKPSVKGKDIILTTDTRIQEIAYNELTKCVNKYNANYGSVIVMEVKTGNILAIANYPSYDANQLAAGNPHLCKNYAVLSLFEPGSIFKIIPAAAAIEYNKVKLNDIVKYEDEDSLIINGHIIKDAHDEGQLTFEESFIVSSNIGFVNIGNKLGKRLLYVMINAMGINKKLNIGLPGEQKGLLLNERKWIPIHQANICFGQGVSVTALQMIAAYNIIANKGIYVKPKIIKSINGKTYQTDSRKRVLKKQTAYKLNELLTKVVLEGTGKNARVKGISIAGKTGTAEKSYKGEYAAHKYTSSFVGYFPADDPNIIMIITIDEPRDIYWGSEVAAPLFASITKRIVNLKEYRKFFKTKQEMHI